MSTPKSIRKKNKSIEIKERKIPIGFNKAHKKAIEKAVGFKPHKIK